MITTDLSRIKWSFWQLWIIANAIGFGCAWALGEWLGQQTAEMLGWRFGQTIGITLFEGLLWLTRGAVLSRVKSYKPLKPIELIVWISTELMAWIISGFPIQENSSMGMMGGIIFATTLGAMGWIVFAFIKIAKPQGKFWGIRAFSWTLFGFVSGTFVISMVQVISFWINDVIAKIFFPAFGRFVAGIILGSLIGAITGAILARLINWKISDLPEYSV